MDGRARVSRRKRVLPLLVALPVAAIGIVVVGNESPDDVRLVVAPPPRPAGLSEREPAVERPRTSSFEVGLGREDPSPRPPVRPAPPVRAEEPAPLVVPVPPEDLRGDPAGLQAWIERLSDRDLALAAGSPVLDGIVATIVALRMGEGLDREGLAALGEFLDRLNARLVSVGAAQSSGR